MAYSREQSVLLKKLPELFLTILKDTNAFVAGGAIASIFSNNKINDYDIYFRNANDYSIAVSSFKSQVGLAQCEVVCTTPNAVTFKTKNKCTIQLISFSFGSPSGIFDKFDFTCCMGAFLFKEGRFFLHPEFLHHLSQRRLVYNTNNDYPLSSLFRVRKFIQKRGYIIDAVNLVKIALAIHKLDLSDVATLHRQLAGVSTSVLELFMKKLERRPGQSYDFEEVVEWLEEAGELGTPAITEKESEIEIEIDEHIDF